ncbi:MAG: PhnD/SsuA/transferrin family substrate-binding protein [Allorhizobium sp.]
MPAASVYANFAAMIRLLFIFALLVYLLATAAEAREVKIAVLAFQGSERAARDFEPTVAHLGRTLREHHFTMVPLDLAGISKAVEARSIDFVITNPGEYVDLESRFGVTRLATLESRDHAVPTDTVGSTVIVPNRPGHAATFAELAGLGV